MALEPGNYPVVLEPAAVAGLLQFLSLDARTADEGRSAFSKAGGGAKIGDKLFGSLTLSSDPWAPLLPTAPFDSEGLARPPVKWVENGVLKKLRVSRYWGKKTGRPADAAYAKLVPSSSRIEPFESLVAGLERGLLVTRLWYIRMLEPQTVTVTGLTRDGVFLVDKGKISHPVNNFRFNQSVLQMFADADAYGPLVRVPGEQGDPAVAPALRCKSFHFSSTSDAV
jgi:predicted Zn-dependent protease